MERTRSPGPRISVITVCLNSSTTIEETLKSVRQQDYANIEYIVIDGRSTDDTMSIVDRYSDVVDIVVSEQDSGIYDAMNKGARLATGDVIGFLNSDDVYASSTILSRVAEAMTSPSYDACYADLDFVSRADGKRVVRRWKSGVFRPGLFSWGWMPPHPTFYVRRSLFEKCGGFDTKYKLQSDFDLLLRLMELNSIKSLYIPETWIHMKIGGASSASIRNVLRGNIEAYDIARKNGFRVTPAFMAWKVLSRVPQFLRARLRT